MTLNAPCGFARAVQKANCSYDMGASHSFRLTQGSSKAKHICEFQNARLTSEIYFRIQ